MNTTNKNTIEKMKDFAFKKNVYLLGANKNGERYWLEEPTWNCGWYWGFGYIKTYKRNAMPSRARDIDSHQHIDSTFIGQQYEYNFEKQAYSKGEYIHNIYDSPLLAATTFDEKTGWILSELFNEFYTLRKTADLFRQGGAHTTTSPLKDLLKSPKHENHINEVLIPAITAKIIELLTPSK